MKMTLSTSKPFIASLSLMVAIASFAGASVANSGESVSLIASKDVPVESFSNRDLKRIYRGKKRLWSNNQKIRAYYLAGNTSAGHIFFDSILDLSYTKFRRHWIRMTFSGSATPPTLQGDVAKMLESVCAGSGAVGFIPTDATIDVGDCKVIPITR